MDTQTDPRLGLGGNFPPDPLIVEADERVDTANKWLSERREITDAEMADKANFFLGQVEGTRKALDDQRLEEGRAFKKAQDAKYSQPLSLLELAKTKLQAMRRAWLLKEDARLEKERKEAEAKIEQARKDAEEAQKRAEAEAKKKKGGDVLRAEIAAQEAVDRVTEVEKAAIQVPDRAHIKGTYTTKATGLRDYWSAEIVDATLAFKTYKKRPEVITAIREAMERVAKADAQKLKDLTAAPEGVKFTMEKR